MPATMHKNVLDPFCFQSYALSLCKIIEISSSQDTGDHQYFIPSVIVYRHFGQNSNWKYKKLPFSI